ncbi:hypothetical protein OEZ86_002017 [Tetradesmus obliquus]|nr:hypothetical protein OEZ86_002017 [Tetradesmus obliquus]
MADLMRLMESHSRSIKQNEDKISAVKQQEEILSKELEDARAVNAQHRQALAEAQAKHGELTAELQQKEASMATCQTCNASAKQTIASTQQQRQALRQALQEMQQAFIADCAALHSHAAVLLGELRCRNLAGLEGALPEEFGLADASGDAAAYVTAAAGAKAGAGAACALAGKQQQLMFEPRQAEEEWCGMGDAAALLYSGGLLQCGGGAAEHQLQHD